MLLPMRTSSPSLYVLALLATIFGGTSDAAIISVAKVEEMQYPNYDSPNRVLVIELQGRIAPGDADRLRATLDKHAFEPWYEFDQIVLSLDSKGGSFAEAIALMDLLRERNVKTYVDADATCLSACAITFLGGTSASVDSQFASRTLRPGGQLGFHAPALAVADAPNVPLSGLNAAYASALRDISALVARSDDFELPDGLLVDMLATPPQEILMIEQVQQANRYGITLEIKGGREPLDDEDIARLCVAQTAYAEAGTSPDFPNSIPSILGSTGVEYISISPLGDAIDVATVLVSEFAGRHCGVADHEIGRPVVAYSFGDRASVAQALATSNWVEAYASRQTILPPAARIAELHAKATNRVTDLSCPYAYETVNEEFDVICDLPHH